MAVGLGPEHAELAASVAGLANRHAPRDGTRARLAELAGGQPPACWQPLVDAQLTTLVLPEGLDGGGAGFAELAVVLEEAGRGLLPGPVVATAVLTGLLRRYGGDALAESAPRLVAGAAGGLALHCGELRARPDGDGLVLDGSVEPVLGAPGADLLLVGARSDDGERWCLLDADADGLKSTALDGVDLTRAVGRVEANGVRVPAGRVLAGVDTDAVRRVAAALLAAEAVGLQRWCLEAALDYVKVREQFDRPVGSFQGVKHKAALLFVRLQTATAAAWDAARALDGADEEQLGQAAAAAAAVCVGDAHEFALDCMTLFGGIGFTWEHDLHLYLRRALSLSQLLGPAGAWTAALGAAVRRGTRRFDVEVESGAAFRAEARGHLQRVAALPEGERMAALAEVGYVAPEYPRPHGIEASAVEQLILAEEFAAVGMKQPSTIIGEFALPTILAHGSPEQVQRFVPATLRGDIVWCQLFSEPGAGSDLASLKTRAERVDGGWRLTGQKVWNSKAHEADWGICLARTDSEAPKHKGISYFLVDMRTPGIDVRPLKQANGASEFNEVFLDGVVVPDECLVGEPGEGWRLARTTLANERLMIASTSGLDELVALVGKVEASPAYRGDPVTASRLGRLAADSYAIAALKMRAMLERLAGFDPGAGTSVLKIAVTDLQRALAVTTLELAAPAGASYDGAGPAVTRYLSLPASMIGGGTREIQLNVIAERVLGLPRG